MYAIRKVITIKDAFLTFKELKQLIGQKVEIIILPLSEKMSLGEMPKSHKANFLKFQGGFASGFTDTSYRVNELIYGQ